MVPDTAPQHVVVVAAIAKGRVMELLVIEPCRYTKMGIDLLRMRKISILIMSMISPKLMMTTRQYRQTLFSPISAFIANIMR